MEDQLRRARGVDLCEDLAFHGRLRLGVSVAEIVRCPGVAAHRTVEGLFGGRISYRLGDVARLPVHVGVEAQYGSGGASGALVGAAAESFGRESADGFERLCVDFS